MKTKLFKTLKALPLFLLISFTSSIFAQQQIADFLKGNVNDAEKLSYAYLEPFGKMFGSSTNGGWYQAARPHKLFGFNVTFVTSVSMVPSSAKTFDISKLDLESLVVVTGQSPIAPTISGASSLTRPQLASNLLPTQPLFDAPKGAGLPFIPMPFLQAGIGLPFHNELTFRGSNRFPRNFGIVLRLVLSQGVTPIFIPPSEPWRNGVIEKFNWTLFKYFYAAQKFAAFEDLEMKAPEFSDFHNQNHRYSSQRGRYPNQIHSTCQDHKLRSINLEDPIPLVSGSVIFIRFVRSDRRLSILGTGFTVKKELVYTYVIAEIVIDEHVLLVIQDSIIHHVFPFAMPVD